MQENTGKGKPAAYALFRVAEAEAGIRLDKWVKKHHPIPQSLLQKLLRKGAIRVNGKRAKADMPLPAGAEVKLPSVKKGPAPQRAVKPVSPKDVSKHITDRIIYEDQYFIAINKLPGIAVQGGTKVGMSIDGLLQGMGGQGAGSKEQGAKENQNAPCSLPPAPSFRLTHRLDKDTGGVLLIAKSRAAAETATKAFKSREFEKVYWAVVMGCPAVREGTINLPLSTADESGNEEKTVVDKENGKYALTNYRVRETAGRKFSWLEVYPETGRKHQIRAHLAAIGYPIVGDYKYGGDVAFVEGFADDLHLHARSLAHPDLLGEAGRIEAPLSGHMKATWSMMGWDTKWGLGIRG